MKKATNASRRRLITLLTVIALMFTLFIPTAFASEKKDVGEKPVYDAATDTYQISTPEHLMYLSGKWKDGAPRDGHYVLTADLDMAGYEGFEPIASKKAEGFTGTFDGQFHSIKNLRVEYEKKYAGFFGYVGNEDEQAYIKNLALLDIYVTGQQNVGGIVGVNYGTITNCVVTGEIVCLDLSNAHTAGGIAGKLKEGEGPIIGHIEDCFVYADVSAPYDAGGIMGMQDGGGYMARCFAAGTVEAYATSGTLGHAGGIAGAFNAGEVLKDSVSAQTVISGAVNTDKIVGQLDDEAATNITGNISWEGTELLGNEPVEQPIIWDDVSSAVLQTESTYKDLGWDMDKVWQWNSDKKTPTLRGFDDSVFDIDLDYTQKGTQIISRAVNTVSMGKSAQITAKVVSADTVESVTLYYGKDEKSVNTAVAMTKNSDGLYTGTIPTSAHGNLYYYIKAVTNKGTITKPYSADIPIVLFVDDGRVLGDPAQITIVPDTEQGGLRFNWLTDPAVTKTVIEYKSASSDEWLKATGTSYVDAVTTGYKEKSSHSVEISGLTPDTEYVYKVGDGEEFMSDEYTFRSPQDASAESFSFIFYADAQSESAENYMSYKKTLDAALKVLPNPAFTMNAGDITQNGYKSTEWEALFEVMDEYYAKYPMVTVPGNHEMKGDWDFVSFAQRFNMSGAETGYESFDRTMGWFEYGDAVFVTLNSEVTPPDQKADIIKKELKWAKEIFKSSDKKWRILMTHAGPYTSNHDPMEVRDYYINDSEYSIDALGVDLFLNGHDHVYIRATVNNDIKVNTGDGTTYLTGGTVGNKYYEYMPDRSDYATDAYVDEEDRQAFVIINVSSDAIIASAYQKADEESFDKFEIVDEFEIRNTQVEGKKISHYTDVSSDNWYYDAAKYVVEERLISGGKPYLFEANANLTRGDIASAIYNLAGQPKTELGSFSDVPLEHQQRAAIGWVSSAKIMTGTGDNVFSPDVAVTREELATIFVRYLAYTGKDISTGDASIEHFADLDTIADWAMDSIRYSVKEGIVQGKPDNLFAPKDKATRAEISTMFKNLDSAA